MFELVRNMDILKLFRLIRKINNYKGTTQGIETSKDEVTAEDKKDVEDLLHALKLTSKTWRANNHHYQIIKYEKLGMTYDMYNAIGIFRSIVLDDTGRVVAFSPPKSLYPNEAVIDNINKNYIGKSDGSNEWHVEEFVEGTMINMFFQPNEEQEGGGVWELATKSTVGAKVSFFANFNKSGKQESVPITINDTFRHMFLDACNKIGFEFDTLPKDYMYSFVLQHPRNRIVSPIKKASIYVTAVYKVNQDTLEVTDITYSNTIDWNSLNVKKPQMYQIDLNNVENTSNIVEYFKNKYTTMNSPYYIVGLMFRNQLTGERVKFRNASYEMVKSLRGNQPKLQYQYLALRQEGKVGEYLKYFPEHKKEFQIFRNQLHAYTKNLHQNYVECYVKKTKPLNEYPKHFRTHMFSLHQIYLNELREQKLPLTIQRAIEYINTQHPAKQMYTLNFTMRKQIIEEERAMLDEKEHMEAHGFEGEGVDSKEIDVTDNKGDN
jgi:hypothetical protein